MRYLAVDFGRKRLGLAISDDTASLASAYATRERRGTRLDVADIIDTLRGLGATGIVMGRPIHLNAGEIGDGEAGADTFAAALQNALTQAGIEIEIERWDERFSTREALGQMREIGLSQKRARQSNGSEGVDARAAAVFLQGFLDHKKNTDAP